MNDKRRPVSRTKKMQSSSSGVSDMERRRRAMPLKRMRNFRNIPGDSNLTERSLQTGSNSGQQPGTSDSIEAGQGRPPIWCRSRSPKIPNAAVPSSLVDTGRTMEQVSYFQIASLLAFASAKLGLPIISFIGSFDHL